VGGLIRLAPPGRRAWSSGPSTPPSSGGRPLAGSEFISPLDLVAIGLAEGEALASIDGDAL
jgi:hypothetical protein